MKEELKTIKSQAETKDAIIKSLAVENKTLAVEIKSQAETIDAIIKLADEVQNQKKVIEVQGKVFENLEINISEINEYRLNDVFFISNQHLNFK